MILLMNTETAMDIFEPIIKKDEEEEVIKLH